MSERHRLPSAKLVPKRSFMPWVDSAEFKSKALTPNPFPMNVEGESSRCHQYAAMLIDHGVEAHILVAETRGDELELD